MEVVKQEMEVFNKRIDKMKISAIIITKKKYIK